MDPFADLPAPENHPPKPEEVQKREREEAPPAVEADDEEPAKRARVEELAEAVEQRKYDEKNAPPPPSAPHPEELQRAANQQITAAIRKIASHIGTAKKFQKAAGLLKKLLEDESKLVKDEHGREIFEALKQGMKDTNLCLDPNLRRDYRDLYVLANSKGKTLFTMRQRVQLQSYVDYCVQRNQALTTDDSFVFSKACTTLRQSIDELMPVEQGEVEEWNRWKTSMQVGAEEEARGRDEGAGGSGRGEGPGGEDLGGAYNDLQMLASRREFLLDFLESLRGVKHLWAKSSIELTWEHAYSKKDKFLPGDQQQRIDRLNTLLKEQALKKKGTGADPGRDLTSFEKNERVWAASTSVSKRGALGSESNVRSNQYLG